MTQDFRPFLGYGSQTGAAETIAADFKAAAAAVGIELTPTRLNDVPVDSLADVTHFVVITSTYGDGELPDNAALFWDDLETREDAPVGHLRHVVLALGDSDYDDFANGGRLVDERLSALGSTAIAERVEVDDDDDFEELTSAWVKTTLELLVAESGGGVQLAGTPQVEDAPAVVEAAIWGRHRPFPARVVVNRLLSGPQSDKEVRHYELDLTGSGITYEPGDTVAVHAPNDPALVQGLIAALGAHAAQSVDGTDAPLAELLTHRLEIRTPSSALLELVRERTSDPECLEALGGSPAARDAWLWGRDVTDLVAVAGLGVEQLLPTLRPLAFRDYSIASSQRVTPDRVALTVSTVRHEHHGRQRGGVASTCLADRSADCTLDIHLKPNQEFRLPGDDVPIIMVGPGTGVAPFRAFLAERRARGATGPSWLFFGDRHEAHDFVYREELEGFLANGTLTRLDTAFSRDQAEKVYVQHRMAEHADELVAWIEQGAHVYVCGDEQQMARDVDAELHHILAAHTGSAELGRERVRDLIRQRRYSRDVY